MSFLLLFEGGGGDYKDIWFLLFARVSYLISSIYSSQLDVYDGKASEEGTALTFIYLFMFRD